MRLAERNVLENDGRYDVWYGNAGKGMEAVMLTMKLSIGSPNFELGG